MGIDVPCALLQTIGTMKKHLQLWKSVGTTSIMLGLLAACHKKPTMMAMDSMAPDESEGLPIVTLTAVPNNIELGQSTVLTWQAKNATSVIIEGVGSRPVSGSETLTPGASTDFRLTATGDGGTVDAHALVTVRTPAPIRSELSEEPERDKRGEMLPDSFSDVFFGYDSFEVATDATPVVAALANYLKAHPKTSVLLSGYCDDRGSAEYNLTLGQNRADSVRNILVTAGIKPDRIRVISFGKEKQFCSIQAEECWHQNRRVQFTLEH